MAPLTCRLFREETAGWTARHAELAPSGELTLYSDANSLSQGDAVSDANTDKHKSKKFGLKKGSAVGRGSDCVLRLDVTKDCLLLHEMAQRLGKQNCLKMVTRSEVHVLSFVDAKELTEWAMQIRGFMASGQARHSGNAISDNRPSKGYGSLANVQQNGNKSFGTAEMGGKAADALTSTSLPFRDSHYSLLRPVAAAAEAKIEANARPASACLPPLSAGWQTTTKPATPTPRDRPQSFMRASDSSDDTHDRVLATKTAAPPSRDRPLSFLRTSTDSSDNAYDRFPAALRQSIPPLTSSERQNVNADSNVATGTYGRMGDVFSGSISSGGSESSSGAVSPIQSPAARVPTRAFQVAPARPKVPPPVPPKRNGLESMVPPSRSPSSMPPAIGARNAVGGATYGQLPAPKAARPAAGGSTYGQLPSPPVARPAAGGSTYGILPGQQNAETHYGKVPGRQNRESRGPFARTHTSSVIPTRAKPKHETYSALPTPQIRAAFSSTPQRAATSDRTVSMFELRSGKKSVDIPAPSSSRGQQQGTHYENIPRSLKNVTAMAAPQTVTRGVAKAFSTPPKQARGPLLSRSKVAADAGKLESEDDMAQHCLALLHDDPALLEEHREFVRCASLLFSFGTSKPVQRHVFMFTDVLVVAVPKDVALGSFDTERVLELKSMAVSRAPPRTGSDPRLVFSTMYEGSSLSFFGVNGPAAIEHRELWLVDVEKLIAQARGRGRIVPGSGGRVIPALDATKPDESLKIILANAELAVFFRSFLERSLNSENLLVLLEMDEFRSLAADWGIGPQAQRIWETYVQLGAQIEINIDSQQRREVEAEMNQPTRFVFDSIRASTWQALTETVPLFLDAPEFGSFADGSGMPPVNDMPDSDFSGLLKRYVQRNSSART